MHAIEQLMQDVNGSTFISLVTETPVKLKGGKGNALQGRVTKLCAGSNVMVFQNKEVNGYAAMVARRLEEEGKDPKAFELSPRQWGVRDQGAPFVRHNGKLYLEVIFLKAGEVTYLVDGVPTDAKDIVGLGLEPKQEGAQGGLENRVILRTYDVANIKMITINHQEHKFF
jgi:hypothetical protein